MKKIIALLAVFLLAVSFGAASSFSETYESDAETTDMDSNTEVIEGQPSYDDITLERGYLAIKDKESDEEYFVHVTGLIDEIRDDDEVTFELKEGRKEIAVKLLCEECSIEGINDTMEGFTRASEPQPLLRTHIGIVADDSDGDGIPDIVLEIREGGEIDMPYLRPDAPTERSERKGRNPQTGKEIKIPAKDTNLVDYLNTVQDEVRFELKDGRKGMNAVNVKRLD